MIISCGEALTDFFKSTTRNEYTPLVGGSLLNVAVAIQKSGTDAALMTNLSSDQFGDVLEQYLQDNHVSTKYITRSGHRSGLIFVHYNDDKSAYYSYYGHDTAEQNYVYNQKSLNLANANCLHFGSFSLVVGKTADSFQQLIKQEYTNRIISIDLNIRPAIEPDMSKWRTIFESLLPTCHIAKASSEDVMLAHDLLDISREQCFEKMHQWAILGAQMAIITDAENGVYILWQGKQIHLNAKAVDIIDTVGAGDCFMGNFLSALDKQAALSLNGFLNVSVEKVKIAANKAIDAASFTIMHKGAIFPKSSEI